MTEFAAKLMHLDINRFFINIEKVANTSSGTIPIALDEMNRNNMLSKEDLIVLTAFGGGLTSGAILLEC